MSENEKTDLYVERSESTSDDLAKNEDLLVSKESFKQNLKQLHHTIVINQQEIDSKDSKKYIQELKKIASTQEKSEINDFKILFGDLFDDVNEADGVAEEVFVDETAEAEQGFFDKFSSKGEEAIIKFQKENNISPEKLAETVAEIKEHMPELTKTKVLGPILTAGGLMIDKFTGSNSLLGSSMEVFGLTKDVLYQKAEKMYKEMINTIRGWVGAPPKYPGLGAAVGGAESTTAVAALEKKTLSSGKHEQKIKNGYKAGEAIDGKVLTYNLKDTPKGDIVYSPVAGKVVGLEKSVPTNTTYPVVAGGFGNYLVIKVDSPDFAKGKTYHVGGLDKDTPRAVGNDISVGDALASTKLGSGIMHEKGFKDGFGEANATEMKVDQLKSNAKMSGYLSTITIDGTTKDVVRNKPNSQASTTPVATATNPPATTTTTTPATTTTTTPPAATPPAATPPAATPPAATPPPATSA